VTASSSQLDDAVAALERGEVVGIPTDTVYGIVTLPAFSDQLYEVKGRPRSLELPILVADATDVDLPPEAAHLAARFWPGKLTIVTSGVGYRVPDHDVPRELARRVGPLASTSANPHGKPPFTTAAHVATLPGVSVVIDGGICEGAPSTVVRVDGDRLEVIREGAIPITALRADRPASG
jgi:L-threonylcarbamoyladenylate synthase